MSIGRRTLGLALRERRLQRGLTLTALREKSGLSVGLLSDIERGRALPSLEALDLWTHALGTSIHELTAGIFPWGSDTRPTASEPPPDGRLRATRAANRSAQTGAALPTPPAEARQQP